MGAQLDTLEVGVLRDGIPKEDGLEVQGEKYPARGGLQRRPTRDITPVDNGGGPHVRVRAGDKWELEPRGGALGLFEEVGERYSDH